MPDSIVIPIGFDASSLSATVTRAVNDAQSRIREIKLKVDSRPLGTISRDLTQFDRSLEASNARVLAFGASVGIIAGVTSAFKALISSTIDVEKRLTEIQSTFSVSSKSFQEFSNQLFQVAKNTGQSFDTVSEAAREFSRQGLSIPEVLKRTNDALVLSRFAGINAAEAVNDLTAAINTFKREAIDSTTILNKLANVDTAFAVTTGDLAEAIKRTGSAAEDAKVSFDELVAVVTAAQQTTARGGAVIGNAFKTIFTRINRGETLDALEDLNIKVRDIEGNTLPAIKVLQNLSERFNGLTDAQKNATASLLGGLFQINILRASLSDLSSGISVYERALKTSSSATDEAIQRNEALNNTFAALINKTQVNLKQLFSTIGSQTFAPVGKSIFTIFNTFFDAANSGSGSDQKSFGQKFGQGLINGLSDFLRGPAVVVVGALLFKLFENAFKSAQSAFKSVTGFNSASEKQREIQEGINRVLQTGNTTYQNRIQQAKTLAEAERAVLDILRQENALVSSRRSANSAVAAALVGQVRFDHPDSTTTSIRPRRFAAGYAPSIEEEARAIRAGVGGAGSSARPVAVKNFALGAGKREDVVVNSDEYLVHNYAGSDGSAVFNREMVKKIGGIANLNKFGRVQKVNAQGGVPNLAQIPLVGKFYDPLKVGEGLTVNDQGQVVPRRLLGGIGFSSTPEARFVGAGSAVRGAGPLTFLNNALTGHNKAVLLPFVSSKGVTDPLASSLKSNEALFTHALATLPNKDKVLQKMLTSGQDIFKILREHSGSDINKLVEQYFLKTKGGRAHLREAGRQLTDPRLREFFMPEGTTIANARQGAYSFNSVMLNRKQGSFGIKNPEAHSSYPFLIHGQTLKENLDEPISFRELFGDTGKATLQATQRFGIRMLSTTNKKDRSLLDRLGFAGGYEPAFRGLDKSQIARHFVKDASEGAFFKDFYDDYSRLNPLHGHDRTVFNSIYAGQSGGVQDSRVFSTSVDIFNRRGKLSGDSKGDPYQYFDILAGLGRGVHPFTKDGKRNVGFRIPKGISPAEMHEFLQSLGGQVSGKLHSGFRIGNLGKALQGIPPTSIKFGAYFNALEGNPTHPIDRHMIASATDAHGGLKDSDLKVTRKDVEFLSEAAQHALRSRKLRDLGFTDTRQIQAAVYGQRSLMAGRNVPDMGHFGREFGRLQLAGGYKPRLRNQFLLEGLDQYNREAGLPINTRIRASKISQQKSFDIADAFDSVPHDPKNPKVVKAYDALKKEVSAQFDFIQNKLGINLLPWTQPGQPYANSREVTQDVKNNKRLYFFTGGDMAPDHPLAAQAGGGLTYNDKFRAIHDVFGHAAEGFQFGAQGEYNAFRKHARSFSPLAKKALAAETLAQNSWVNFGRHLRNDAGVVPKKGEPGYIPITERPYAEQKATLLPNRFLREFAGGFVPILKPRIAETIANIHNEYGGVSYHFKKGNLAGTDAYALSVFPENSVILPKETISPEDVQEYYQKNFKLLRHPLSALGGWFDKGSGQTYLDVSTTTGNLGAALAAARRANQKAIFSLKDFREISTGGTGDSTNLHLPSGIPRLKYLFGENYKKSFARGYSPLSEAISREHAAGVPLHQIFVDKVHTSGYSGMVVGNRRDEPTHSDLVHAVKAHPNPARAGMPNYVAPQVPAQLQSAFSGDFRRKSAADLEGVIQGVVADAAAQLDVAELRTPTKSLQRKFNQAIINALEVDVSPGELKGFARNVYEAINRTSKSVISDPTKLNNLADSKENAVNSINESLQLFQRKFESTQAHSQFEDHIQPLSAQNRAIMVQDLRRNFFNERGLTQHSDQDLARYAPQVFTHGTEAARATIASRDFQGSLQRTLIQLKEPGALSRVPIVGGFLNDVAGNFGIERRFRNVVSTNTREAIERKNVVQQLRTERANTLQNRGFQASFLLPLIAGELQSFAGINPESKRGRTFQGVSSAVSGGISIASLAPGSQGAVVGGLIAAFGSLKAITDNLARSLEESVAKLNDANNKRAEEITNVTNVAQSLANLQDVIKSHGSPTAVAGATTALNQAVAQVPSRQQARVRAALATNDPEAVLRITNDLALTAGRRKGLSQAQALELKANEDKGLFSNGLLNSIGGRRAAYSEALGREGITASLTRGRVGFARFLGGNQPFRTNETEVNKAYKNLDLALSSKEIRRLRDVRKTQGDEKAFESVQKLAGLNPEEIKAARGATRAAVGGDEEKARAVYKKRVDAILKESEASEKNTRAALESNFKIRDANKLLDRLITQINTRGSITAERAQGRRDLALGGARGLAEAYQPFLSRRAQANVDLQLGKIGIRNDYLTGVNSLGGELLSSLPKSLPDIGSKPELQNEILRRFGTIAKNPEQVTSGVQGILDFIGKNNSAKPPETREGKDAYEKTLSDKLTELSGKLVELRDRSDQQIQVAEQQRVLQEASIRQEERSTVLGGDFRKLKDYDFSTVRQGNAAGARLGKFVDRPVFTDQGSELNNFFHPVRDLDREARPRRALERLQATGGLELVQQGLIRDPASKDIVRQQIARATQGQILNTIDTMLRDKNLNPTLRTDLLKQRADSGNIASVQAARFVPYEQGQEPKSLQDRIAYARTNALGTSEQNIQIIAQEIRKVSENTLNINKTLADIGGLSDAPKENKANGHLPYLKELAAIRAGVGGALPGDRPITKHVRDLGNVVVNSGEKVGENFLGTGRSAILTRRMQKAFPNFAATDPIFGEAFKKRLLARSGSVIVPTELGEAAEYYKDEKMYGKYLHSRLSGAFNRRLLTKQGYIPVSEAGSSLDAIAEATGSVGRKKSNAFFFSTSGAGGQGYARGNYRKGNYLSPDLSLDKLAETKGNRFLPTSERFSKTLRRAGLKSFEDVRGLSYDSHILKPIGGLQSQGIIFPGETITTEFLDHAGNVNARGARDYMIQEAYQLERQNSFSKTLLGATGRFRDYSNRFPYDEFRSHVATTEGGFAKTVRYSTSNKTSPIRSLLPNLYESAKIKAIEKAALNAVGDLPSKARKGAQVFGVDVARIDPEFARASNQYLGYEKFASYRRGLAERVFRGNFGEKHGYFGALELNPTNAGGASGNAAHALETQAFLAGARGETPIHALDQLFRGGSKTSKAASGGMRLIPRGNQGSLNVGLFADALIGAGKGVGGGVGFVGRSFGSVFAPSAPTLVNPLASLSGKPLSALTVGDAGTAVKGLVGGAVKNTFRLFTSPFGGLGGDLKNLATAGSRLSGGAAILGRIGGGAAIASSVYDLVSAHRESDPLAKAGALAKTGTNAASLFLSGGGQLALTAGSIIGSAADKLVGKITGNKDLADTKISYNVAGDIAGGLATAYEASKIARKNKVKGSGFFDLINPFSSATAHTDALTPDEIASIKKGSKKRIAAQRESHEPASPITAALEKVKETIQSTFEASDRYQDPRDYTSARIESSARRAGYRNAAQRDQFVNTGNLDTKSVYASAIADEGTKSLYGSAIAIGVGAGGQPIFDTPYTPSASVRGSNLPNTPLPAGAIGIDGNGQYIYDPDAKKNKAGGYIPIFAISEEDDINSYFSRLSRQQYQRISAKAPYANRTSEVLPALLTNSFRQVPLGPKSGLTFNGGLGRRAYGATKRSRNKAEREFNRIGLNGASASDLILSGVLGTDINGENLSEAISREKEALSARGYYASGLVQVGYSPRIGGLGVYNKIDEPFGIDQGINRVIREGGNPRTAGTPNFAEVTNKLTDAINALQEKVVAQQSGINVSHDHNLQLSIGGEVRSSNAAVQQVASEELSRFKESFEERLRDLEISHAKKNKDYVLRPRNA